MVMHAVLTSPGRPAMQILLDFGLAEELTPRVRKHFISFLHCIARGDGNRGAYHMLQFGEKQACLHPAAFTTDMQDMFRQECDIHSKRGVDVDRVGTPLEAVVVLARCSALDTCSKGVLPCKRRHERRTYCSSNGSTM